MSARDPHRFVNDLDASTVGRLVDRLESRGRDAVFTRLLDQYLARLNLRDQRVLEIGCGTGVVTRAIARATDFTGTVTGIDQSPVFIATARGLAEIGPGATPTYQIGDAHELPFENGSFDIAIGHTVISHVAEPARMLAEMARVLAPGGQAVLFDGDYSSLSFAHPDADYGRTMDTALAHATFNNPRVMRSLPSDLAEHGLRVRETLADVVFEAGSASYFRSFAETYAPMVAENGMLPAADVEAWLETQRAAMSDGRFFASCNYYAVIAER